MKIQVALLVLGGSLAALTGCTASKSSPQRHAYRRNADAIKQQVMKGTRSQHTFTGNASDSWNNDMENKDAVLFGNELSAAYLDGYLGVK